MGSATTPIAPSISRYHASPRRFTFLSLICVNGLKCASSNVRPFSGQFVPAGDSEATRAAVTSPAFAAVSAGALQPALIPSARHRLATPRGPSEFIETISSFRVERLMLAQKSFRAENFCGAMLKTQRKKSQRSATKMDSAGKMVDVTGLEPATPCLQSDATKSILLVRLALFCVLVRGLGPSLAAIGPKLDSNLTPCRTPCLMACFTS